MILGAESRVVSGIMRCYFCTQLLKVKINRELSLDHKKETGQEKFGISEYKISCWHPSVSKDNGFAHWSSFRGRDATATVAVEPNQRAAGLLAGRTHKGCVVEGIRCCPHSSALPLHLRLLFQFLFCFDRCRFCGQPPHISVSSQGFKVGRCNIASPEVEFADIFIPEGWSTSGSFTIQHILWYPPILHAGYMAKPAKSSLCQYAEHAGDSSPFKGFIKH